MKNKIVTDTPSSSSNVTDVFFPPPGESVVVDEWFEYILGVSERNMTQEYLAKNTKQLPTGEMCYTNPLSKKTFQCGTLEYPTLQELRQRVFDKLQITSPTSIASETPTTSTTPSLHHIFSKTQNATFPTDAPLHLQIRTVDGSALATKAVDIAVLQANPSFQGSLFQAASNFNGVEAAFSESPPDSPNFVTGYAFDRTQGPRASVMCPAAAIYRVKSALSQFPASLEAEEGSEDYANWQKMKHQPQRWHQTATRQLNMLDNIKEYIPVRNGYAIMTKSCPTLPNKSTDPIEYQSLIDNCRLVVHKNAEVSFTGEAYKDPENFDHQYQKSDQVTVPQLLHDKYNTTTSNKTKKHIIDQLFCAAVNVGQEYCGAINSRVPGSVEKQRFCLDLAYTGSYYAAIANSNPYLVLTMIGCGVFSNNPKDAMDAIVNAHRHIGDLMSSKVVDDKSSNSEDTSLHTAILPLFSKQLIPHAEYLANECKKYKIPFTWYHYTKDSVKPIVRDSYEL